MKFLATIIILAFLCTSAASQNRLTINSKKIYSKNNVLYFNSKNNLYQKDGKNIEFLYSSMSIKGIHTQPSLTWSNFYLNNKGYLYVLRFNQVCIGCDSLKLESTYKNIFFEHRNTTIPLKNSTRILGLLYLPSQEELNIPSSNFFDKSSDNFYYDFLADSSSVKLLLSSGGKLHIYETADSKHLVKNEWKHLKTLDINFKTDYFISYYDKKHERIQVLFDKRGTVSIDPTTWKWTRDSTAQNTDKYLLIDPNHPMDVKIISKQTAYDLTQK